MIEQCALYVPCSRCRYGRNLGFGSTDSILGMREYCCPHCGQLMAKLYDFEIYVCVKGDYCYNCGQALDWNVEEKKE